MNSSASVQRKLNDDLWKTVVDLHEQLQTIVRSDKPTTTPTESQILQAELDLSRDSSSYAYADDVIKKIVNNEAVSESEKEQYTTEIIESFYQLRELNALLEASIEREAEKLAYMQSFLKEQLEINEALKSMKGRELAAAGTVPSSPQPSETDTSRASNKSDQDDARLESQQLEDDLHYVSRCIRDKQVESSTRKDSCGEEKKTSLGDLILTLVEERLNSPEDPFVLVQATESLVDPLHVELLTKSFVAETYRNDRSFLCLTDYRE